MKNYKFATMIQNIGDINSMPSTINAREVFLTLINGFMYVQPGEDTLKFFSEFRRCLKDGREAGEAMYARRDRHIPFNKCVRTMTAVAFMNCIKENFDEEYFDSMLDKIECELESNRQKKFHCELEFKHHQDLVDLLESFRAFDIALNGCARVTSNDNFEPLMAKIIRYADIKTAYVYAHMVLELYQSLNLNVFDSRNLEISIDWTRVA